MGMKRPVVLPSLALFRFFIIFLLFFGSTYAIGSFSAQDGYENTYRELKKRIANHVNFLATHAVLADKNSLVIPHSFTNVLVRELADAIRAGGTGCLRAFWKINRMELLDNEIACRDFVFLLVALYHNLACAKIFFVSGAPRRGAPERGIPWLSLAALYMRLNAIPLGKLFDILDECYTHYQAILNDYGTPAQPSASLADWFVDFWWLPTLMIGMAAATLVRWIRARQPKKSLAPSQSRDRTGGNSCLLLR